MSQEVRKLLTTTIRVFVQVMSMLHIVVEFCSPYSSTTKRNKIENSSKNLGKGSEKRKAHYDTAAGQ